MFKVQGLKFVWFLFLVPCALNLVPFLVLVSWFLDLGVWFFNSNKKDNVQK